VTPLTDAHTEAMGAASTVKLCLLRRRVDKV
jgi:hypothetical protein